MVLHLAQSVAHPVDSKAPLGGIVAQARLGSECLWRRTPRAAPEELNLLVRRLWRTQSAYGTRQRSAHAFSANTSRWQVSQVHLAHDIAHAPLKSDQLDRYVSRSRKQSVFEAARTDLAALYRGLDAAHPVDTFMESGLDWDTLYDGDDDIYLDPFNGDDDRPLHSEEPVPAEDRAMMLHRFGRRVSGVTWSPGAANPVWSPFGVPIAGMGQRQ